MQQDLFALPEQIPLAQADVRLHRSFLAADEAEYFFHILQNTVNWQQPMITVAGRQHKIPRLQAWFGEEQAVYQYSGTTFMPQPWTRELDLIRIKVEQACAAEFNSVLLNYYRDGEDGMGMHSDNEPELGPQPTIASLSLGGQRRFAFQSVLKRLGKAELTGVAQHTRMPGARHVLTLGSGDLLIMSGATQQFWRHGVPKTRRAVAGRINLTFRHIWPRD